MSGIFIDLSKAFDTIDHRKLEKYGIRGVCHNLLKSYLTNRTQITTFQHTESDPCSIEYGVPQGSVLGPLLFLIYINDITNIESATLANFVLFADDTNIFVSGKDENEVFENANNVLNEVHHYMIANQLHINMSKSVYMHFRRNLNTEGRLTCARAREYGSENTLHLGNQKLKKVDQVKFLGVIIDDKLNWEPHIHHLTQKLNLSIIMIKRIIKFIPKSEYMKIYDALFKSHLSYCISCWGAIPHSKLEGLFAIQKRCIRLFFGLEYTFDHAGYYETCARSRTYQDHISKKTYDLEHTKPLCNKHNILNLFNLFTYHTFLEIFKILKTKLPVSLFSLLNQGQRDTNFLLHLPDVDLDISKRNFIFSSSSIWNKINGFILEKMYLHA